MLKWKKRITIIIVVIIILFGVAKITKIDQLLMFIWTTGNLSKVENFGNHQRDHQLIVDKVIKLRSEGKISKEDNYVIIQEGKMYNNHKIVKLTDEEKRSLSNIIKTFDEENYPLEIIRTYGDNYIVFAVAEYPFGVVYSEDGSRPNSLGLLNEKDRNYKVRKLAPNWYDVEDR